MDPASTYVLTLYSGVDIWVDTWKKALESCKAKLISTDYSRVVAFGSAGQLLDDLREMEQKGGKPWLAGISRDVRPILAMLDEASQWFLVCMRPTSIQVTMLWGLLHITIKVPLLRDLLLPLQIGIEMQPC